MLSTNGPVAVAVCAEKEDTFANYQSGVYTAAIPCNGTRANHAGKYILLNHKENKILFIFKFYKSYALAMAQHK
jgi:hypothetical protein